jgi:F-type H+-transporting ATPase subunit b
MPLSIALSVLLAGGSVIDLDGTIIVQVALFFIAFFLLRSLVIKPVMDVLDARDHAIDGSKVEAQKLQSQADAKKQTLEEELRKIWEVANQERDRLRAEGQQQVRQLTERARQETEVTLADAKTKLEAEAVKIRAEVRGIIPGLARQISSKILDREVN